MYYGYTLKIIFIGNSFVGKSSILSQYVNNEYVSVYNPTMGIDFLTKITTHNGLNSRLQIWDATGQERFKMITSSYYRGVHLSVIVYDITDRNSFDGVVSWYEQAEKFGREPMLKFLVGNKSDLEDKRVVEYQEGKQFADNFNMEFIEVSANDKPSVDTLFIKIMDTVDNVDIYDRNYNIQVAPQKSIKKNENRCFC